MPHHALLLGNRHRYRWRFIAAQRADRVEERKDRHHAGSDIGGPELDGLVEGVLVAVAGPVGQGLAHLPQHAFLVRRQIVQLAGPMLQQRQLLQSHGNIGPGARHELLLLLVEMQLLLLLLVVVGQRRRLGRRGRLRCA